MPTIDPVPGLFPGGGRIHLLGGSNYAGKSTIMAQLCDSLLRGVDFFGFPVTKFSPENLHVVFCDRIEDDNMEWLDKLTIKPSVLSLVDDKIYIEKIKKNDFSDRFNPVSGYEQFKWIVEKIKPAPGSFIILDVFSNVFIGRDIQNNGETRANMIAIANHCKYLNVSILGTCYGVKIQSDKASRYARLIDRIIGGASFRGSASTISYATTKEEAAMEDLPIPNDAKDIQVLEIVPRSGEAHTIYIRRNRTTGFMERLAVPVTTKNADVTPIAPRISCRTDLMELFVTEPIVSLELCRARFSGKYEDSNIKMTLGRMRKEGLVDRLDEGLYRLSEAAVRSPR